MAEINLLNVYPASRRTAESIEERFRRLTDDDIVTARRFGEEYFDGDRKFGYGGYVYDGRWRAVAERMRSHYDLHPSARILDVGCAKGFLVNDFLELMPGSSVFGLDISEYATRRATPLARPRLCVGDMRALPFPNGWFDLVISINAIHNLPEDGCRQALAEIARVSRRHSFVMVDAWRTPAERERLLKWDTAGQTFLHTDDWKGLFQAATYRGDYYWFFA